MKWTQIFTIVLLISSVKSFGQQNPQFLEDLPRSTTFEFLSESDLYVSETHNTELYLAKIDANTTVIYLITQDIPDCAVIPNPFSGYDIYKKNINEGFQRIIHIRKAGENFKIHYVGKNNENEKLIATASISDGHNLTSAMKIGYTLYWNDFF